MPYVAGIDGMKGGWVAVVVDVDTKAMWLEPLATIAAVAQLPTPMLAVGIDMPIGLLEVVSMGGRACDIAVRRRLSPRGSCVFPAPPRPVAICVADGAGRPAANAMMVQLGAKAGLSLQAFSFAPKVAEVDRFMTPSLQAVLREVHPELCFMEMTGGPPLPRKKTAAGRAARLRALAGVGLGGAAALLDRSLPGAKPDDVLDACAAAWSALRITKGAEASYPTKPPVDARGLRMEIVV